MKYKLQDVVQKTDGLLRGPFGSALKKSLFVPKGSNTYKVYEQSVPLQQDETIGNYYISKEYFDSEMSRFNVKAGDFVVSCSGVNYGAIIQLSNNAEQGVINQALLRIRLNNSIIDDDYFLYLFHSFINRKITSGTGDSTIPNFPPMEFVRNIEFDLPPLQVQKHIGTTLKQIDEKISNNKAICSDLEEMAKLIYDYWFVQFDFPDENGKPYKSSGGKMIYNEELKREIPEGWEVKKIEDIADLYQPQTISEKDFDKNGKYIVFGANGIIGKYNKYNHKDNEIAICCRGANCGNFLMTYPYSWITGNSMVVKPKISTFKEYIYYNLSYKVISKFITGSAQPQITRTNLENMKIILAQKEIINKFDILAQKIRNKIVNNQKESQDLASLRDFLLPMLMNGQVKVGNPSA